MIKAIVLVALLCSTAVLAQEEPPEELPEVNRVVRQLDMMNPAIETMQEVAQEAAQQMGNIAKTMSKQATDAVGTVMTMFTPRARRSPQVPPPPPPPEGPPMMSTMPNLHHG